MNVLLNFSSYALLSRYDSVPVYEGSSNGATVSGDVHEL